MRLGYIQHTITQRFGSLNGSGQTYLKKHRANPRVCYHPTMLSRNRARSRVNAIFSYNRARHAIARTRNRTNARNPSTRNHHCIQSSRSAQRVEMPHARASRARANPRARNHAIAQKRIRTRTQTCNRAIARPGDCTIARSGAQTHYCAIVQDRGWSTSRPNKRVNMQTRNRTARNANARPDPHTLT